MSVTATQAACGWFLLMRSNRVFAQVPRSASCVFLSQEKEKEKRRRRKKKADAAHQRVLLSQEHSCDGHKDPATLCAHLSRSTGDGPETPGRLQFPTLLHPCHPFGMPTVDRKRPRATRVSSSLSRGGTEARSGDTTNRVSVGCVFFSTRKRSMFSGCAVQSAVVGACAKEIV